jgi:regulatory protein
VPRSSKPESAVDEKACRVQALSLLARREHSRLELERKLSARSFASATVKVTLDALERSGLLAVERFAESFVRARFLKGQGPLRIRAELAARGIDDATASGALAAGEWDWADAAKQARTKRFGPAAPDSFAERARQARFLQQRGFDAEHVRVALDIAANSD